MFQKNSIGHIIDILKKDKKTWDQFQSYIVEKEIPSKTTLLAENKIASHIFFIKRGCLRKWFNKDGKDITFQFFFEGQSVASFDSFINGEPGLFSIESIEPSILYVLKKSDFDKLIIANPNVKDLFQNLVFQRLSYYSHLFLSRIKDSPKERYMDLLQNQPDIIKRVPQHYIASYLGITSVSLSRIRNRK